MSSRYKYFATYGLRPPSFIKNQEQDDDAFGRGYLGKVNTGLMNNTRQLIDNNANDLETSDPLSCLCGMGMLDLLDHDEQEKILLVITATKNRRMAKLFTGGRTMKRMKTEYLVVKNAKVKNITLARTRKVM